MGCLPALSGTCQHILTRPIRNTLKLSFARVGKHKKKSMIDQEGPRMAEGERLDTKFQMTKLKHFSQIFQKEKLLSRVQLSVGIFKLLEI